jgi:hypothetical protein
VNLRETNLHRAHLAKADLSGADLRKANLRETGLREADLSGANLTGANLNGSNLAGAVLTYASLVETKLDGATLANCRVYGVSAWNVSLSGTTQTNLIISKPGEPSIVVDNLEIAQFLYLIIDHKKLRDMLTALTQRGVLLLGGFREGGLERLQALAGRLRDMQYLPIIFDFDRPPNRTYTETVKTLVGLSRFVIADMSGPSVPQELMATVPHFKIPFVFIIERKKTPWAMSVDFLENDNVIRPPWSMWIPSIL